MATRLTAHFTLEELTASTTAKRLGIANTPTPEHVANLHELAERILEPLRIAWGSPIFITSGYRGFNLNKSVKGSTTSAHCYGLAADMIPANGEMAAFKAFVRDYMHKTNTSYDQYIDEAKPNGSEWVHVGIRNSQGKQRKQDLITTDGVKYRLLPKWTKKG